MSEPDPLLDSLVLEVNALTEPDKTRAASKITLARAYLTTAIAGYEVPEAIKDDCVVSIAADLYNAKNAQLGIMNVADGEMTAMRVSTDPLRSAWPKLNAAGVPTGGIVIA